MINYEVDLHGHTTLSDGQDSPKEYIDYAVSIGMKVVAITDHDVLPPKTIKVDDMIIDIKEYAYSKGLEIVLGTEISCDTDNEDVHLLLFGCDWSDPRFAQLENDVSQSKIESYKRLVDLLADEGMKLDWNEILHNHGNPVEEKDIQKKMIFNMLAEKGYFKSWKDAKMMTQTNKKMDIRRKKPDPVDIIKLAHDTKGIVIDAHPFLIHHEPEVLYKYLQRLVDAGLDGIEARYTYEKANYKGNETRFQLEQRIRDKYGKMGLFMSGGSDYHGEWKKGATDPREMGETGLTLEEYRKSIVANIIHSRM